MIESTAVAAWAGLGVAVALMTAVWAASVVWRDASLVDRYWGAGFVVLAWFWFAVSDSSLAALVPLALVSVWGLRLSLYLTWRNWGHGEDPRYRAMREQHGETFVWRSLVTVFLLQGAILWLVAMPLLVAVRELDAAALAAWPAVLGMGVFAIGLAFEAVGDWQLARFKARPGNAGKVMDRGLWRYTRHPNYFGDILVWWGLFGVALAAGGWWTLFAPAIMTFLLARVSGVTLLERRLHETRPAYRDYVARTNALVPWFPREG